MMEIYYVDENGAKKSLDKEDTRITPDTLTDRVRSMDIMADVEILSKSRGIVRVHKGVGTTMYLAKADDNFGWLQFNSVKKEERGSVTLYHFVFD